MRAFPGAASPVGTARATPEAAGGRCTGGHNARAGKANYYNVTFIPALM